MINLRKLRLQESHLDGFRDNLVLQRGLVRHIWLDIELPGYDCTRCERRERYDEHNTEIVDRATRKLFSILSKWKLGETRNGDGLVLELNAYCLSDTDHWFKGLCLDSDTDDHQGDEEVASHGWDDPRHGWINGGLSVTPPRDAMLRLFERLPEALEEKAELPPVHVVTSLVLRRQMRRQMPRYLLKVLPRSLCRLENLIYEPWRAWLCRDATESDIYERLDRTDLNPRGFLRVMLERMAQDLEHLSLSYVFDAADFFGDRWTWKHLQTLALTSNLLRPNGRHPAIRDLLLDMGKAAYDMTKLRTLVLWNGAVGHAFAFVYRVEGAYGYVSRRGTWDLEIDDEVKATWEHVANRRDLKALWVEEGQKIRDKIMSHGDAIHYLNLACQVVSPASLWQIRKEAVITKPLSTAP